MRILHVTYIFPPKPNVADGITHVVYHLTKTLAKNGHDVTVYASNAMDLHGKERIEINSSPACVDGVKVRYFPYLLRYGTVFFTPSMFRLIRDEIKKFDVIHIHDARCLQSAITMHYAELFNIPIIFQPHGSFKSPLPYGKLRKISRLFIDKLYAEKILQKCSKMVALSWVEAEQYKRMGVPEEKIATIPNGIDLSEYANLPPRGCFKKKFGIKEEEKIVLYLGRIHRIKGIDILVKAFASVVKELDNVKLAIVGPDDGYLNELRILIKALKMENNVLITGPLYGKDKLEAYVDAEVYVLPSRYETFPMSILEAVACGTPIILTENCAINEYFRSKVGLAVKPDPSALSGALLEMLLNKQQMSTFRQNCRTIVEAFSISRTVSKLERAYEDAAHD